MKADKATRDAAAAEAARRQEAAALAARQATERARATARPAEQAQTTVKPAEDGRQSNGELDNSWDNAAEGALQMDLPDDPAAQFKAIAAQLTRNPDLKSYPPEAIETFGALRAVNDPDLQKALDKVAAKALGDPNFKLASLRTSSGFSQLLGASQSPVIKSKLQQKFNEFAKSSLEGHLEGKKGEEGVKEATQKFQDDLVSLARATGLGPQVQKAAEEAPKALEDKIKDTIDSGKNIFQKIGGAFSSVVSSVFGGVGKAVEEAVGAVGEVAKVAVSAAGEVATAPLDLAAAGLSAVGLDSASKAVKKVDSAVESGFDFVGDQADKFTEGVGAALGGTVTGLGGIIADPIGTVKGIAYLATHPQDLPKVGKALWQEATKGGAAYAIGYIAGNLAPALLTGGSSAGAGVSARIGAIAGKSKLLTTGLALARGSKVGQITSKLAVGAKYVKNIPTRGISFVARNSVGKLTTKLGQQAVIRNLATRIGTSAPAQAVKNVAEAIARRKFAFNNKVDDFLSAGVKKLDDSSVGRTLTREAGDALKVQTQNRIQGALTRHLVPNDPGFNSRRSFAEAQAATEPEIAARAAAIDRDAAVVARNLDNRPPGSPATFKEFEAAEEAFETLRQNDPQLLREVHRQAYVDAGLDPKEVEGLIEAYTTSSTKVNRETFDAINDSAKHVFDGGAPRPGQKFDQIIYDIRRTRAQRAQAVSEALGVPVPDRLTVFRGSDSEARVAKAIEAFRDRQVSEFVYADRGGVASSSLDPRVPPEFGRKGALQAETVGHEIQDGVAVTDELGRKIYQEPKGAYVAVEFDITQNDVLFDKYVDGGRSAQGPAAQTLQREYLLAQGPGERFTTSDRLTIGVGDKTFTLGDDYDELLSAVATHGSDKLKAELTRIGIALPGA